MAKIEIDGRTAENIGFQLRTAIKQALTEAKSFGEHDTVIKVDDDLGKVIEVTFNAGTDEEIRCDLELHWSVKLD